MTKLERPQTTNLPETEQPPINHTTHNYSENRGSEQSERDVPWWRKRTYQIIGGLVVGATVTAGVGSSLYAYDKARDVTSVVQSLGTTAPIEAPSPSASPEFPPITDPLNHKLEGTFENIDKTDYETLREANLFQYDKFGGSVVEGIVQELANYNPTEEEVKEWEARAKAEFIADGGSYNARYGHGGSKFAVEVLLPRAEAAIVGVAAVQAGGSLHPAEKQFEYKGVFHKIITDAQIRKFQEKLKYIEAKEAGKEDAVEGEYRVDLDVVYESRRERNQVMEQADESFMGELNYGTIFTIKDTDGAARAVYLTSHTSPEANAETITQEDGIEISVLTKNNGKIKTDKNGNAIPYAIVDEITVVQTFDSLEALDEEYGLVIENYRKE